MLLGVLPYEEPKLGRFLGRRVELITASAHEQALCVRLVLCVRSCRGQNTEPLECAQSTESREQHGGVREGSDAVCETRERIRKLLVFVPTCNNGAYAQVGKRGLGCWCGWHCVEIGVKLGRNWYTKAQSRFPGGIPADNFAVRHRLL